MLFNAMKNPEDYTHACYETRHETTLTSSTPYTLLTRDSLTRLIGVEKPVYQVEDVNCIAEW